MTYSSGTITITTIMLSEIYETTILKVYLKLFRWNIDMKHEQGGKEEMKIFSVLIAYLNIQVI